MKLNKLKYLLYRLKWHLAVLIPFKNPVHVDIELNNTCNQRCISCWHSEEKLPFTLNIMSRERAFMYLKEYRKLGCMSVKFNLRGEPLLHPDLIECIREAKSLGFIDIMINTNGTLLTRAYAEMLSISGLTTLIISVDSLDPVNYQTLHGTNRRDYDKLANNLADLRKHYQEYGFKTILNFHVNSVNVLEDFKFYFKLFKMFKVVVRHTENRHGKKISIAKHKGRKRKCPHMERRITITANYKIYPCCVCYDEPEDIRLSYGNISYATASMRALRSSYKKKLYSETCTNCTSGDIWRK